MDGDRHHCRIFVWCWRFGPFPFSFSNPVNDEKYKDFLEPLMDLRRDMILHPHGNVHFGAGSCGLRLVVLKAKISATLLITFITLLVVLDLFPTNRNYLSDRDFVSKRGYQQNFTPRPVDEQILSDKDPNFRVYDASINTFNQASTSYFHKTIGGYSAVKLQRMQDLIERQIAKGNQRVLDMLNTKYFMMPGSSGQEGQEVAQRNPKTYGNAWIVDTLVIVNTPDEEIAALDSIEKRKAIVHNEFKNYVADLKPTGEGEINLTNYEPNALSYSATVPADQLAVFSEVWYGPNKGWYVTIDGKEVEHIRVNYLLRALKIPAGSHEIKFDFKPEKYFKGEKISLISSSLILLLLLFVFVVTILKGRKADIQQPVKNV
ncbi:MAG: YfhO family protein [Saprospiraceae bacterium]|nr:YfhO family protein [Saprospiraceae bacterium]